MKPTPHRLSYLGVKLRWSVLLLIAVSTFVVLANAPETNNLSEIQSTHPKNFTAKDFKATKDSIQTIALTRLNEKKLSPGTETFSPPVAEKVALESNTQFAPPTGHSKRKHTVKRGDSLSSILNRYRLSNAMKDLLPLNKKNKTLFNIDQGDTIELVTKDDQLLSLKRVVDKKTEVLALLKDNGDYSVETIKKKTSIRKAYSTGTVSNSFYQAGLAAGLSHQVIINAADILGWDIDFVLDVRKGDTFAIIYNEEWLEGEKLADLEILAIEYINQGKSHRAMRHTNSKGVTHYYTPSGKNVRRAFIRTPLEFTRISSHFNPRRLHPIHKVYRPHRGVDYAAPTGTPVYSTGDGKVIFRGRKGGYGNVVIIQHGHRYKTLYAHLSKFARKVRVGTYVKQKQTIGYVGSTGYATGPHLHYEFRINDVHKNPLKVQLPPAKSIPKRELKNFNNAARSVWAKLDIMGRSRQYATKK